jgi:tetratricopeptide (TPR) repeat protein
LEDALRIHREILSIRKAKLGPNHVETISSMANIAVALDRLGRYPEAIKLYEETIALKKAKLGRDHPDTLNSIGNLAESYDAIGRHDDARKLLEEALALRKAKLGSNHRVTLINMSSLARTYDILGRHAESAQLLKQTIALQTASLGADHPDTLQSMDILAHCYASTGNKAEALKTFEQTLARRRTTLGAEHPDTLVSKWFVAETLLGAERGAEAIPLIDDCLRLAPGKDVTPDLVPSVIRLRLQHFQKTANPDGCRQSAGIWEGLKRSDAESLYTACRLRAVTSAVVRAHDKSATGAQEADFEADLAIRWLKQAIAAGYQDVAGIKKQSDLDSLRSREDFKKLVAELDAKKPKMP